jgi:hypothetical protein
MKEAENLKIEQNSPLKKSELIIHENQLLRSKGALKEKNAQGPEDPNAAVDQSAFTYKASLEITKYDINENQNISSENR